MSLRRCASCNAIQDHATAFGELVDGSVMAWTYCRSCGVINFTATGLPEDTVRVLSLRGASLRAVNGGRS